MPVFAAIFSIAFHSPSVTQKDFFLFRVRLHRVRSCLVNHFHLCFFVKVGSGFRPKKIMRLAPAAFGGGSPNALLAPLKAGSKVLQLVYIPLKFCHWFSPFFFNMGAVFLVQISKQKALLIWISRNKQNKNLPLSFLCSACSQSGRNAES